MKNRDSENFFKDNKRTYTKPALLIPYNGSSPFVGILHTSPKTGSYLLTKAFSIDKILEKGVDFENGKEFHIPEGKILFSYNENEPFIVDPRLYEIVFSQDDIIDFLKEKGAVFVQITPPITRINNFIHNSELLKSIRKNEFILVQQNESASFYLGYANNPQRDLKRGSNYITLDNVLLISKKPSPLEGNFHEWNGFHFFDNGITYNTMTKFSVPLSSRAGFYKEDELVNILEKEAKRYKPLEPLVEAVYDIVQIN